jgi:ABC-2 type transport system permease protein
MDMIKFSTDWARAEVFSAKIVWLFSIVELLAAAGFWYWGRTAMAKAFIGPLLPRIPNFENEYRREPKAFLQAEIQRTAKSQRDLARVFQILPAIVVLAALVGARNDVYHQQLLDIKP